MSPDVIKTITISVVLFALFVVLPIVVLMLEHQRKMVLLMRGESEKDTSTDFIKALAGVESTDQAEVDALRNRVTLLEAQVAQLSARSLPDGESEAMKQRLQ